MSDLARPFGFEDALRPPVDVRRARITPGLLKKLDLGPKGLRAKADRVARRVPEVMVKITGKTRSGRHLISHLSYIARDGALTLEGPDGERIEGPGALKDLAEDWAAEAALDPRRRKGAPISLSIVLSMPAGTDPRRLHDAGRAFAREVFQDRFPYVFALHDEGRHPHVHLTVRARGAGGERLNPRKADLQLWRETFARALRERGVEAEATPRRARLVQRKAERTPVRKLRERFERGEGEIPRVLAGAISAVLKSEPEHPAEAVGRRRAERISARYRDEGRAAPPVQPTLRAEILEQVRLRDRKRERER